MVGHVRDRFIAVEGYFLLGIWPPALPSSLGEVWSEALPAADELVGRVAAGKAEYSVVFTSSFPRDQPMAAGHEPYEVVLSTIGR